MKIYYQKQTPYDQEYGNKDALYINNFGYYEGINEDITISRPCGRLDHHLIYVANGEVKVGDEILKNGDYCIYAPKQPQYYTYLSMEGCRYYWVHFVGNRTADILRNEALTTGIHSGNGRQSEADALFLALSRASSYAGDRHSDYAVSLLYAVLSLFSEASPDTFPFSRAKKHLENISSHESVAELAKLYGMTPEHFIRSFRSVYGATPANYRIMHQLAQAENLLLDTQLTIGSIAEMCGYTDRYYFSRLFKKHVGTTPTQYRKGFKA